VSSNLKIIDPKTRFFNAIQNRNIESVCKLMIAQGFNAETTGIFHGITLFF